MIQLVMVSPGGSSAGSRLFVGLVGLRIALPLMLLHPAWEFHRDELLYSAMADHFDLFRMQFPPLIALVTKLGHAVFGTSVMAARVPAAIAGGALTAVVLWLVRRLGGGSLAMVAAWLALLGAPVFMRPSVLLHPVILDQVWCAVAVGGAMVALRTEEPRWWLLTGLAFGLGALTKFSVAFYVVALVAAVAATPALRRQLATPWPWAAVVIAVVLAVPSLTGQIVNDWPFLRSLAELRRTQLGHVEPGGFLGGQFLMLGPAVVAAGFGLVGALRGESVARFAGLFAVALIGLLLILGGKEYYAAPAWPAVIAVGALELERRAHAATGLARRAWQIVPFAVVTVGTLGLLPMGVPLLSPGAMARYAESIGVGTRTNRGEILALPQDYADMLGWRAQARAVGEVVRELPAADQAGITVVGSNYGRAGALALYRDAERLPYPISIHGDFYAWGPGPGTGETAVLLDEPDALASLRQIWSEVHEVRRVGDPRSVVEERVVSIYLARGLRRPLAEVWRDIGPRWE